MEIGVNQQFYSWRAKKRKVCKCTEKTEILYFTKEVIKAAVFEAKSTLSLSNIWYDTHLVWLPPCICADKESNKGKMLKEKGEVFL